MLVIVLRRSASLHEVTQYFKVLKHESNASCSTYMIPMRKDSIHAMHGAAHYEIVIQQSSRAM